MCLLIGVSQASVITLINPGFEQPAVGKISDGFDGATDVPGWNSGTMTDSGVATGESLGAYKGSYSGNIRGTTSWLPTSDGPAWQLTGHTITAGEIFTVSFQAAANWIQTATGEITVSLYYDDTGSRVIMDSVTVTGLDTVDWTAGSLTVAADDYPASIGNTIGVQFENLGNGWILIDDVQLAESDSGTNIPPIVDAGPNQSLSFAQTISATLNATITDDNPNNMGQIGVDYGVIQWSCPASAGVIFADPSNPNTTVMFPSAGYYVLQLYVQDDAGNEVTDTVTINMWIGDEFRSRAANMVSQMTLLQKIGQLGNTTPAISSLGLPAYEYWNEALHGVARQGLATVFPQCIGMGSMWDDELLYDIFSAVSDEARVKANTTGRGLTYWTPTINLGRDPRWGRNEETYGEDPYHLSRMAVAIVKGLQGDNPTYLKTVATAKHFIANNTETGRHTLSSNIDMRNLREFYMPAFKAAVTEGKAYSVMAAYNALNGIPCPANTWLLTDVLRAEWGFDGYVVSDCWAIADIYNGYLVDGGHYYVSSYEDACAVAINAGTDLNCGYYYQTYLPSAVSQGKVTEAAVDNALTNVLTARFKLGEFDDPADVPYTSIPFSKLDCQEHRDLAYLAAQKSMVLLKNDGILPLDPDAINSIAVIGPNADQCVIGGYSGTPPYCISPLDGITNKLSGTSITVNYTQGCNITGGLVTVPSGYFTSGLTGEYFSNLLLSDSPDYTQLDRSINFNWGTGAPIGLPHDGFSVRWTGALTAPETRAYQIGVRSDDGFRLYIDGVKILEDWTTRAPKTVSAGVTLNAGQEYNIVLEYFEDWGGAEVQLVWDYGVTFNTATSLAASSDVVIVCVGTNLDIANEENDLNQYQMPGVQESMIQAIYNINPNTIVVLINGNPLGFEWTAKNVPAILEAWYAGQSQGTAIADVLFGDYNPGGRLSQTFYKSENQLPDRFDYDIINGGWTYQYFDGDVQYPFGHGLSYTEFTYSNLMVSPDVLSASDTVTVEFDVRNTGDVAGDEVAQVYLRDAQASVKVANKQLRGFKRITLNAGQSQHLTFDIPVSELGYYDEFQEDFIVEGGIFDVLVGSSSQDIRLQDNFVVRPSVDVDNSGLVDVDDLMRIVLEWLSDAACYTTDMCNGADLDGSGFVDLGDMVVLSHHWLEYQ